MTTRTMAGRFRQALALVFLLSASLTSGFPASPGILPDLTIEEARLEGFNQTLLKVKVANVGTLAAAQTELSLRIERPSGVRDTVALVPVLKSGERRWIAIALGLRPEPTDAVILRIDYPPRLEEADESNNVFVYPRRNL